MSVRQATKPRYPSDSTGRRIVGNNDMPTAAPFPSHYGTQIPFKVAYTHYARKAVDLLIDSRTGEVRTRLDGNISATADTSLEKIRSRFPALCESHAEMRRIFRTMETLLPGDLGRFINGICAENTRDNPLQGDAADIVRATLNLPPHHPVTKVEARKAVLMSLLGNLRQDRVGSCFATGMAIALLESDPMWVAMQLKQLLEQQWLGEKWVAPLNTSCNASSVDKRLALDTQGAYGEEPSGKKKYLYQVPGMQAALKDLGFTEPSFQKLAVMTAIRNLGDEPSYRDIIAEIARLNLPQSVNSLDFYDTRPQETRVVSAINAFLGTENVRLLRAWEYTLASQAEVANAMKIALLNDWGGTHIAEMADDILNVLKQTPAAQHALTTEGTVAEPFFADVKMRLLDYLSLQFDAGLALGDASVDGFSGLGGFVMYHNVSTPQTPQWKRIQSADQLQFAIARAVTDAWEQCLCDDAYQHTQLASTAPFLVSQLHGPAVSALLQKQRAGANQMGLHALYGSEICGILDDHEEAVEPDDPQARAFLIDRLIDFLGETLGRPEVRRNMIRKGDALNDDHFRIPLAATGHVFSLMAGEMASIWRDGFSTRDWMIQLENSAEACLHQSVLLDEGGEEIDDSRQIFEGVLEDLALKMQLDGAEWHAFIDFARSRNHSEDFASPYAPDTMGRLHHITKNYLQYRLDNGSLDGPAVEDKLARIERLLLDLAPKSMKRLIADTNWCDFLNDDLPRFVGILHNPFRDRLEMHFMNQNGNEFQGEVSLRWLAGFWELGSPFFMD